jgi:hypothetical protein
MNLLLNQKNKKVNRMLNENQVQDVLKKVLMEETSKVSRHDFSKVQFKIDELENSLVETMKELRKLEDSVPTGLETLTKGRINMISTNLSNSHKLIKVLKDKVRQYKRNLYAQSIEEKKK